MNTGEIPAGQSVADYNDRARRVIDRRINGLLEIVAPARVQDRPRRRRQNPGAVRIQARAQRETYLATLRADPGHEEQAVGCERAEAPRLVGVRRADHDSAAVRPKAPDAAL